MNKTVILVGFFIYSNQVLSMSHDVIFSACEQIYNDNMSHYGCTVNADSRVQNGEDLEKVVRSICKNTKTRTEENTCFYSAFRIFKGKNFYKTSFAFLEGEDINLEESEFIYVDLFGVNLSNANLKNSKLLGVDLSSANLENANLEGAELKSQYYAACTEPSTTQFGHHTLLMRDADLKGANLKNVFIGKEFKTQGIPDLRNADFRGANLEGAVINALLSGAKFNEATNLPFSKEEALKRGMKFVK